jgi:uncharacterized RDD family membrane protein YckC
MAEQAQGSSGEYGGFLSRALALVADTAIVLLIISALVVALTLAMGASGTALGSALGSLVGFLYWPLMQASARQATFGKSMMGLKVAGPDGGRISILRSLAREIAKAVLSTFLLIGFLIAAFTARKQALHDFVASTTVVKAGESHALRAIGVAVAGFVLPIVAIPMLLGAAALGTLMEMAGQEKPAAKQVAKAPAKPAVKAPAKAAPASKPAAPAPAVAAAPGELARGSVVIPGTFRWDIETNQLKPEGSDIWWQHQTATERYLSPTSGALMARLEAGSYELASAAELAQAKFASQGLVGSDSGSQLQPGAVIALRSSEGNLAKLRVVRLRNSHDFSFAGNEGLRDEWKAFVRSRPDMPNYHIELEYVLYPAASVAQAKPAPAPAPAPALVQVAATTPAAPAAAEPVKLAQAFPVAAADSPKSAPPRPRAASQPRPVAAPASTAAAPPPPPNPKFNDVMSAVLSRDLAGVNELIALGRWADKPDSEGRTPLMVAARLGERPIAEALLKAGANPNRSAPGGATSLTAARDPAMVDLLRRSGAR